MIPSPYERQAPRTIRARSPIRAASSAVSRDLPTPASPTTVTSRQPPPPTRVELGLEQRELLAAADERRAAPARQRPVRAHLEQPEGGQRLRLALRRDRRDRLDRDGVPHEPVGRLAEQHLARRGRLLEPGGDVDRVAEHDRVARGEHLAPGSVAGDDLAGVDADPHRDPSVERRASAPGSRARPGRRAARRPRAPPAPRTCRRPRRR